MRGGLTSTAATVYKIPRLHCATIFGVLGVLIVVGGEYLDEIPFPIPNVYISLRRLHGVDLLRTMPILVGELGGILRP